MKNVSNPTLTMLLALTMGALLAGGCGLDEGAACEIDSDCEGDLVCNLYTNVCARPELVCETDHHCPAGTVCGAEHLCVPETPGGGDADVSEPDDAGVGEDTTVTPPPRDTVAGSDGEAADVPRADVDLPACPPLPVTMLRATVFQIGLDGKPGSGLDVDGDPATCSPPRKCEAGVDNALAPIGSLANATLAQSVNALTLNILLTAHPELEDGAAASCPFLFLSRTGVAVGDEASDGFRIEPGAAAPPCADGARFTDACLEGDSLRAGYHADATYPLVLALLGAELHIPVYEARVEGTLTADGADLIVAGHVFIEDIYDAVDAIPPEQLPTPPGPDGIKDMVRAALEEFDSGPKGPDIDSDGDDVADAYSVGLHIVAEPVPVVGFTEGGE